MKGNPCIPLYSHTFNIYIAPIFISLKRLDDLLSELVPNGEAETCYTSGNDTFIHI